MIYYKIISIFFILIIITSSEAKTLAPPLMMINYLNLLRKRSQLSSVKTYFLAYLDTYPVVGCVTVCFEVDCSCLTGSGFTSSLLAYLDTYPEDEICCDCVSFEADGSLSDLLYLD